MLKYSYMFDIELRVSSCYQDALGCKFMVKNSSYVQQWTKITRLLNHDGEHLLKIHWNTFFLMISDCV